MAKQLKDMKAGALMSGKAPHTIAKENVAQHGIHESISSVPDLATGYRTPLAAQNAMQTEIVMAQPATGKTLPNMLAQKQAIKKREEIEKAQQVEEANGTAGEEAAAAYEEDGEKAEDESEEEMDEEIDEEEESDESDYESDDATDDETQHSSNNVGQKVTNATIENATPAVDAAANVKVDAKAAEVSAAPAQPTTAKKPKNKVVCDPKQRALKFTTPQFIDVVCHKLFVKPLTPMELKADFLHHLPHIDAETMHEMLTIAIKKIRPRRIGLKGLLYFFSPNMFLTNRPNLPNLPGTDPNKMKQL